MWNTSHAPRRCIRLDQRGMGQEGENKQQAIEELRFARQVVDLEERFESEKELNELLENAETAHQANLKKIRKTAKDDRKQDEADRIKDRNKTIAAELALEMEALEAQNEMRILDIERQDINRQEKEQLLLENQLTFEQQQLDIREQFAQRDVALEIATERTKDDIDQQAADKRNKRLQDGGMIANTIAKSATDFFAFQKNLELELAGDNEEKKAEIEKKFARRQQAVDLVQALINTALAVTAGLAAPAIPPFPSAIAAGIAGATQVALIASKKFHRGTVLSGPSHAQKGIPFTVGGRPGFEAEGGEAIINKQSTGMFRPLLSAINKAGGGVGFETGGVTPWRWAAQAGTVLPTPASAIAITESTEESIQQTQSALAESLNESLQDLEISVVEAAISGTQATVAEHQQIVDF